jgi:hypothetical protein
MASLRGSSGSAHAPNPVAQMTYDGSDSTSARLIPSRHACGDGVTGSRLGVVETWGWAAL